jgi:phosphoesterase RecJ-like protein
MSADTATKSGRQAVQEALLRHGRCLISTHVSPEGDALGSALALAHALRGLGKEALVVNRDPVPRLLDFLPSQGLFRQVSRVEGEHDLLVVVDCGDLERTALFNERRPPLVVNIDHHITNKQFGGINWVEPDAAATAEMIAELLGAMGVPVTSEIALCLFTALLSETGSFRYSNTTPRVFRLAAELAERGVQPAEVAQKIYERNTLPRLKLLGALLERLELNADRTVAWVTIPAELFARTGTTAEDAEDFVNYPRSLEATQVAMLIRDAGPGLVKVSFRASGPVDVSAIASQFGGGGHRKAAGCTVAGGIEEVRAKVVAAAERAVQETIQTVAAKR